MVALAVGTDTGLVGVGRDDAAALAGRRVGAVAPAPGGPWWAILDGEEVWRADGGKGWHPVAATPGPGLTCLLPTATGLLAGTAEAHLYRLAGDELEPVASFDRVEGRQHWYTPWGGPPDTRWLAGDGGGRLYAGVHVGGIAVSDDSGRSWQPTALDIHADVHQVATVPGTTTVLAPCAVGLAISDDGGRSWRIDVDGLHDTYARAVAVAGETVVVSVSTGPRTDRAGLYRRPLHSREPFERCRTGLPEWFTDNVDTGCLVARGPTAACASPEGAVWVSTDGARSWRQAATGLPPVHCLALVG